MASSLRPSISSFRFAGASLLAHSITSSSTHTRRLASFHIDFGAVIVLFTQR